MHDGACRAAHQPDQRLDPEGEEGRRQHEDEAQADDLPADQRARDQEVRVLRDQIEERLRHGERGQRTEVKPSDWQRHDRWRAERTHVAAA
jgi:hypothetical protein